MSNMLSTLIDIAKSVYSKLPENIVPINEQNPYMFTADSTPPFKNSVSLYLRDKDKNITITIKIVEDK